MRRNILFLMLLSFEFIHADSILLNEYNAVAEDKLLKNSGYDTHFQTILGNGGSWIELVVNEDFIDLRGSIIEIKRSKGVHQLTASFPNLTELAYLRKGTILTISNEPTDLSYSPLDSTNPDWTINLNSNDLVDIDGAFEISDRTMDISIKSLDGTVLMQNSGEIVKGWGIDNQEVFKLKKDPNSNIQPNDPAYGDDASNKQIISTYGSPNQWIDSNDVTHIQDFTNLRDINSSVHQMVLLNEYDAVRKDLKLKKKGYDTYFGRIKGNGKSWVELVVLKDKTDLRQSEIKIVRDGNKIFRATLPNIQQLSEVRSGTILTISNKVATDLSYDPFNQCNPDWNININIDDLTILEGKFKTTHKDLVVSLKSGRGDITIMPKSGEGVAGGNVGRREVFKLKKDPSFAVTPTDTTYGDDNNSMALSTFGIENHWRDSNGTLIKQNFINLRLIAMRENFRRKKTSLVLNEYNAVASNKYLKGSGHDDYFGYVEGNGGSWLEMVVTRDYLNLQNATIKIKENCNETFSAKIPELLSLAYLRKGTVVTISNEPTDMTYSPFAPNSGDWKLNININDLTNKSGLFNLNDNKIDVSIVDSNGTNILLANSGEGIWSEVVDDQEVYKLKSEPNATVSPFSDSYGDDLNTTVISTFNSANRWLDSSGVEKTQQFTVRNNKDLVETGGIVLSNIAGLEALRDAESILFIPQNNSLWITDDDSHHIYEMDYDTHVIKSTFSDIDLGTFAPEIGVCGYEYHKGACDTESVAYDVASDSLYIFTGLAPGTPAIFKLTRNSVNESFALSDYRKLDNIEYPATQFINGQFVIAIGKTLYNYDFDTNSVDMNNSLYTTPTGKIVGLAIDGDTLWVTTSNFELHKVNWTTKTTEATYQMRDNGVYDPRGIEVVNGKLHILEGVNNTGSDFVAPIGHALKNAIHIYNIPQ